MKLFDHLLIHRRFTRQWGQLRPQSWRIFNRVEQTNGGRNTNFKAGGYGTYAIGMQRCA